MFVTEEEAKAKWCQERFTPDSACNCIGSACMAWRISDPAGLPHYEYGKELPVGTVPADPGWEKDGGPFAHQPWKDGDGTLTFQNWRRLVSAAPPALGYCGKAGKP